ncbi:MAG TPA: ABC transporter substrate-binding protein [Opitutaceae bacterium]
MARFLQSGRHLIPIRTVFRSPVLLLAGALALAAGCSKQAGPVSGAPLPKVRFKTDWYPQAEHGGFYQALAKGYYKEAGIDVEIVPGGPGVLVPQIVLSGQVDIAMGRSDDIIAWGSQGLPFVIVGVYMERDPQAILVHDESPVKTFADLNGRTIMGVPGSNWIEYLKLHYHIDFRLIPSNFGIAQFMADPNFIQQCFVTNEPFFVRKNGGHPRTLLMSDSGFKPYRVLYTTQRYLRDHTPEVRAFVAASLRGWADFMNGDPTPGKALIAKNNENMSDAFMDYSIQAMRDYHIVTGEPGTGDRLGLMTRARLEEQIHDLVQLKIIPELLPVDKFARFDLMPPEVHAGAN